MSPADKVRNEAHIAHDAAHGAFHRVDHDVKHSAGGAPSPAIGLEDIPYDVVGPFLRFSGVDLATSTWKGSCLLLVRLPGEGNDGVTRRHRGKASSPREKEPLETSSTRNQLREQRIVDGTILPIMGSGVSSIKRSTHQTTDLDQWDEFGVPLPPRGRLPLLGSSIGLGWNEATRVNSQQPRLILRERELNQWNQTTSPSGSSTAGDTFQIDPTILVEDIFGFRVWRFDIAIRQNQEYGKIIDYRIDIPSLGATELSPEIAIDDLPMGPNHGSTGSRHSPPLTTKEWNAWHSFVVPGLETKMRAAFFSCNGFEATTRDAPEGVGLPTLWTDVLRSHMKSPFHVLIGGGDQIYNDDVFNSPNQPINEWMKIESRSERENHPWTKEMDAFAKSFYFKNYCLHFMTKPYADVIRTIPHVFICDDHDIFDGFGSYPSPLQNSPVFKGIGAVAIQAFLLFQHHTTSDLARDHGLFPARPGSNGIQRRGFNFVVRVNRSVAIVGLDNRTERSKDRVLSDESREAVKEAMRMEAIKGGLEHTLILNAVPMIFGDIGSVEKLQERLSEALRSEGALNWIVKKFGLWKLETLKFGEPQLLDDCIDHWTSHHHLTERNSLLWEFSQFAARYGSRVTILTGDVHCCGVGRLRSEGVKTREEEATDPMTMYQIISSAICNQPPPAIVVRWLFEGTDHPPSGIFKRHKHNGRITEISGDEIILGRVEEGLVRFKELHRLWSASVRGDQNANRWGAGSVVEEKPLVGFRDAAHLKRVGKRKLIQHRNWCEITQLPGHVPTRLSFLLHVERAHFAKLSRKLRMPRDPHLWAGQLKKLDKEMKEMARKIGPETNVYGVVVEGLEGWPNRDVITPLEQSKGLGRIEAQLPRSSAAEEKMVDMIGLGSLAPQYIGQLEE